MIIVRPVPVISDRKDTHASVVWCVDKDEY